MCVLSLPQIVRGPVDFRFFLIWQALIINAHCFPFLSKHPVKTVLCGFYSLFIFALDCSPVLYHRVCRCKNKADIISQSNPLICGIHAIITVRSSALMTVQWVQNMLLPSSITICIWSTPIFVVRILLFGWKTQSAARRPIDVCDCSCSQHRPFSVSALIATPGNLALIFR